MTKSSAAPRGNQAPDAPAVPLHYLGVWQRQVLEQDARLDTRSLVYWLQASSWHADLRIPAERPDFRGVAGLGDCDDGQLAWLAAQQGFCGVTEVDGARCRWHRRVDFQPDTGRLDLGQMAFTGNRLIEVGIEADYLEIWQRVPGSMDETAVLQLAGEAGRRPERQTWLLVVGRWFAYVRPRAVELPAATSLAELIAVRHPSRGRLIEWLDFEISVGRHDHAQPWRIEHSTLPFREGVTLFEAGAAPKRIGDALASAGARDWNILEWNLAAL